MKQKILKEEKAITLVALIITIIVLLILAIVSIQLVMNGGIIGKAERGTDKYSEEEIGEQLKLVYSEFEMGKFSDTIDIQEKLQEVFGNETTATIKNGKLKVTINGKIYQYNIETGVLEEYKDSFDYGEKDKETLVAGDDITLGTEKFKVFSVTATEIKAMPYYNVELKTDNPKQTTTYSLTRFSSTAYWEKGKDIDMTAKNGEEYKNYVQQYVDAYKETLITLKADNIDVRLATYSELNDSTITNIMRNPGGGYTFWIATGYNVYVNNVDIVQADGTIASLDKYASVSGVRPIIIIPKSSNG